MPDDPNTGSVYGTPMPWAEKTNVSDRDLYGYVCVHGSLARSCETCGLQAKARQLREERDDLESGYYALLSQCHNLEEKIKNLQEDRESIIRQRDKDLKWARYWRTEIHPHNKERNQSLAETKELRAERSAMLDALDELEYLTRDACVEQDGPYVDGVRLDELQDARAVLDHARTLIGENNE